MKLKHGKEKKIKTQRGKYLRACPDIESIHKKPTATSKLPLLQNGNVLRPQYISGRHIMIMNTCAFEIVLCKHY